MSDPHDREPIDQATIDCWRINYGLDKRTPAEAAQWWHDSMRGFAPSGAVAALGVALDELESLRKDAAAAVLQEREHWQHVAQVQQASYEREIVIEVEAERERCATICEMRQIAWLDEAVAHERAGDIPARDRTAMRAYGNGDSAAAIRATPPAAPAPAQSAPA